MNTLNGNGRYDNANSPHSPGNIDNLLNNIVKKNIKHVYGPETVEYMCNEVVVVCVVRDGQRYIQSFIEHYFLLGVKHIVLLDNNSSDKTISIAKMYENVTIFSTRLSFKNFKNRMRDYLIKRFGKDRWILCVDIDELFDYPFSDRITVKDFLNYLNEYSYTAVVAYMLDMFSDKRLEDLKDMEDRPLKDVYKFYDIVSIKKVSYSQKFCPHNMVSNEVIKHYMGGIRRAVFGLGYVHLTKHPLIFSDKKIKRSQNSSHKVENAYIADITGVLLHYKFTSDFYEYVLRVVKEESHYNNSQEYKAYLKVLEYEKNISLMQGSSRKLENSKELIDNRFLLVSDAYMEWIRKCEDEKMLETTAKAKRYK